MANVCDPALFPDHRYFEQHELAEFGPPHHTYAHTRGLRIRTAPSPFSAELVDWIGPTGRYPGIPYDPADTDTDWDQVLKKLFDPPVVSTSFDFTLWFSSRIGILIEDDFWWFSTKMAPITMKHQYGAQYFDLLLHHLDRGRLISLTLDQWRASPPTPKCRCISFFTGEPCTDPAVDTSRPLVKHGFSLNLELASPGKGPLPITIDPDVENKGGNPGP